MPCQWGVLGAGFIANRAVIPAIQRTPDARVLAIASREEQRTFAPADPYQLMVQHFTDCVQGRAALLYPAEDGRKTLEVLDKLRTQSRV